MWLLISSESENSRFGEFGGDFGEGGARVFPWEKISVQFNLKRQEVGLFSYFLCTKSATEPKKEWPAFTFQDGLKPNVQFHTLLFDIEI